MQNRTHWLTQRIECTGNANPRIEGSGVSQGFPSPSLHYLLDINLELMSAKSQWTNPVLLTAYVLLNRETATGTSGVPLGPVQVAAELCPNHCHLSSDTTGIISMGSCPAATLFVALTMKTLPSSHVQKSCANGGWISVIRTSSLGYGRLSSKSPNQ